MIVSDQNFQARLTRIMRRRGGMTAGAIYRIDGTGLVRATAAPVGPVFPFGRLAMLVALAVAFKVTCYVVMGGVAYGQMVAEIGNDNPFARAAVWLFQPDDLTRFLASFVNDVLR